MHMRVCIYVYVYVYTHAHTHYIYKHVCVRVCVYIDIYLYIIVSSLLFITLNVKSQHCNLAGNLGICLSMIVGKKKIFIVDKISL